MELDKRSQVTIVSHLDHGIISNGPSYDNYEDEVQEKPTFLQLSQDCAAPTFVSIMKTLLVPLIMCLLFRFLCRNVLKGDEMKHAVSGLFGIISLYFFVGELTIYPFAFGVLTLLSLHILLFKRYRTIFLGTVLLVYLVACEFIMDPEPWHRIRYVQMVIVMKMWSLSEDIDEKEVPSYVAMFGYIFCVGNVLFGPWVTFVEYMKMYKTKKSAPWNFPKIMFAALQAQIFFAFSMCYISWLASDFEWSVMKMYGKALEFRAGSYFIIYVSVVMALSSGLIQMGQKGKFKPYYTMISPLKVELPRSLVQVVIYWNIPMHKWFKIYVFIPLMTKYGNFAAVAGTYIVSSMLHGLDYQLSAVLLSLAFYTYAEHTLRAKLSRKWSACVSAKPCPKLCTYHKYTRKCWEVFLVNMLFSLLAIYHLAYLGYLVNLDKDGMTGFLASFDRWVEMDFASHKIALAMFFFALII